MVEILRPFLHQRLAGRSGDGISLPDVLHDEAYLERVVMAVHSRAATLDELAGPKIMNCFNSALAYVCTEDISVARKRLTYH